VIIDFLRANQKDPPDVGVADLERILVSETRGDYKVKLFWSGEKQRDEVMAPFEGTKKKKKETFSERGETKSAGKVPLLRWGMTRGKKKWGQGGGMI